MVGIFSRFSVSKTVHRRTQSAIDEREVLPPNPETTLAAAMARASSVSSSHGIEIAFEFKPVQCPKEPLDIDRPTQCPWPEPSMLNDGKIWKERVCIARRQADIPIMQEATTAEREAAERNPRPPMNRVILPSLST